MNQHHSETQVKFWGKNEKKFWGQKNFFSEGKKLVFLKKKIQKKFWKKFFFDFFFDFFNIIVPYFDSNRFFQAKSLSYHIKLFFGPAFRLISENLVE